MARGRSPDRDKAFEIYKKHNGNIDLVEIASQLKKPPGTIRGWKNKDKWDDLLNGTLQKNAESSKRKKNTSTKPLAEEVKEVLENTELTDKQRLFCLYYIKCFNATKAYQKAYECSYETAASIAYRLLGNDGIKSEINKLKQQKLNQVFLKPEDVFQKYMDIAFADITDYLEFGREEIVVSKDDNGKDVKMQINTVKFKESTNIDGTIISEVKKGKDGASIKLHDRLKALQWLADHMDLATEEQRARIDVLKAKANLEEGTTEDDGFIEALAGKVDEVWQEVFKNNFDA